MTKFKPQYSVHRSLGKTSVTVDGDTIAVIKITCGSNRNWFCHFRTGRQSKLYPTQRDCINNIVYGV